VLIEKSKSIMISTIYNNEVVTLESSEDWSIWLKSVRDLANNTVTIFMKSMERFWIWSLYTPVGLKESFPSYQARYRESLRDGFEISVNEYSQEYGNTVKVVVCSSKPMLKSTVNKELAGINSYFYFTEESKLIDDHRFINHLYEKQKRVSALIGLFLE